MRPLEPARRSRSWRVVSLMVATAMLGVSACGAQGSSAPTVLTDKGTPYSDLLIPELTATVSDGSVGVLVDQPVTVSVQGGVLGSVTMVNDAGESARPMNRWLKSARDNCCSGRPVSRECS